MKIQPKPSEYMDPSPRTWIRWDCDAKSLWVKRSIMLKQPVEQIMEWVNKCDPTQKTKILKEIHFRKDRDFYKFSNALNENLEYVAQLEENGFCVAPLLSMSVLSSMSTHTNKRQFLSRVLSGGNTLSHLHVFAAVCRNVNAMSQAELQWLLPKMKLDAVVKENSRTVIECLAEAGRLADKKDQHWSNYLMLVQEVPNAKLLVKRTINFPNKDNWLGNAALFAAGFELWGEECVVPSRKPILLDAFNQAIQSSKEKRHASMPSVSISTKIKEKVRAFLLRDHMLSSIGTIDHKSPKTKRKI